MSYVGFQRMATVPVGNDKKELVEAPIVIQGDDNQGATVSADITGLAKDATSTPGSDKEYYVNRRGVGTPKVDLGVLDWPDETSDIISGYKVTNGLTRVGEDTEAPFASLVLESHGLDGSIALIGFYKGSYARDKFSMNTTDPSKATEPAADTYTYTAVTSDGVAPAKGHVMVKYTGKDQAMIDSLVTEVMGSKMQTAWKALDSYPTVGDEEAATGEAPSESGVSTPSK